MGRGLKYECIQHPCRYRWNPVRRGSYQASMADPARVGALNLRGPVYERRMSNAAH